MIVGACVTAEIINTLGAIYSTEEKPFKPMNVSDFLESWTGEKAKGKKKITQEYVEEVLAAIKAREEAVTFMYQQ